MEFNPIEQRETLEEKNLRLAQARNQALYDRMLARRGREEPNPLRVAINECIARARPNEGVAEIPNTQL